MALPRHDAALPRALKVAKEALWLRRVDIVCHTVAGTHAGMYVPRLILGLSTNNSLTSQCHSLLHLTS